MDRACARDLCPTRDSLLGAKPMTALNAIHRRLGREIQTFVGELRHQLLRREAGVPGARQHTDDLRFLDGREGVVGTAMRATSTIVARWLASPALDGTCRDTSDSACLHQPSARRLRLGDRRENYFSLCSSVSSSSSW